MRARIVWVVAAMALCSEAAEVRVWQDVLTLPSYQEGAPNPNPPFDQFAATRFNYPYTLRESITDRRVDTAWRAVYVENEYLKCSVLPDIGGHLYTCIDKISGESMFYANPSIKKAQIGYRGAWAAFGIEFNFPVSHNWVSMSPVDFSWGKNGDGSASVWVGNIDHPYGMQWTVELRLGPGSTVLEERVTLYNRSDVRHRFYWWNNAGVRVWEDSKIWYPMRWAASHGFTAVDTWPVNLAGVDVSVIGNQTKGTVSEFVHGSREPFMGVYHPKTQTGVAHYADYADLPAKKIWSWGVDADGLDWRRALSDDNSGYVEVQAGLMRNQETYAFLEPRQSIHFTEYWMPVRGIGGIARANLAGVLQLDRAGNRLIAGFNTNRAVAGGKVRILAGTRVVREEAVDLAPERTWRMEIADAGPGPLTFELRDAGGHMLMRQMEGEYDWTPEAEIRTGAQARLPAGGALDAGADLELNGNLPAAYEAYERALGQAPDDLALRVAAGRLAASLLRYEDAVKWLEPAQARATQDAEIAYYLGLAYQGLGRMREARLQLETARRMPRWRAAGNLKLGELLGRAGDLAGAATYLEEAMRSEPDDQRAREEWTAVERALGRTPEAAMPGLSLFLSGETGSDAERVLGIAAEYMRLGLWREALAGLSRAYPAAPPEQREPGVPPPGQHPMVAYYRGFCRQKLGESGAADYDLAAKLPTAYAFPNGAQTQEVLESVVRERPGDGTAHFLLGELRMASGRTAAAIEEWRTAQKLNPSIPVLQANLGRVLLRIQRDVPGAAEAFRAGLAADPSNTEIYAGLGTTLGMLGKPAGEVAAALERYPDKAGMPAALVYDLALSYAEAGRFEDAKAIFQGRFFPREEGGTNVRQVWIRVRALEAAAAGHCDAALAIVDTIGEAVAGLAFTRDGLERFIAAAPNQAALGGAEARCGRAGAAAERVRSLSVAGDAESLTFGYELARQLPGFQAAEWTARLQAAGRRGGAGSSWNSVLAGMRELDLGRMDEGRALIESGLLLPDRNLAHHLGREALRGIGKR
jgi:tetratricopeptide (TPR) repeat protein